jgi:Iap family predicted aminopeptidase
VRTPRRNTWIQIERASRVQTLKRLRCLAIYTESILIRREGVPSAISRPICLSTGHHFITEKDTPDNGRVIIHHDHKHR